MNNTKVPMIAAVAMLLSAALIAGLFHRFDAELWIPSLVCNLFTTGTAILLINFFSERLLREARQRPIAIVPQLAGSILVMIASNTLNGFTIGAKEGLASVQLIMHQFKDAEDWISRNTDTYRAVLDAPTTRALDVGLRATLTLRDLKLHSDAHRTLDEAYRALRDMIGTADWITKTYPAKGDDGIALAYAKQRLAEFESKHGIKYQGGSPEDSRMRVVKTTRPRDDDSWRVQG